MEPASFVDPDPPEPPPAESEDSVTSMESELSISIAPSNKPPFPAPDENAVEYGVIPFVSGNVDVGDNTITLAGHSLTTGAKVKFRGADLPAGLTAYQQYYVHVTGDDITLHSNSTDAGTGANPVDLTDAGSGSDLELLWDEYLAITASGTFALDHDVVFSRHGIVAGKSNIVIDGASHPRGYAIIKFNTGKWSGTAYPSSSQGAYGVHIYRAGYPETANNFGTISGASTGTSLIIRNCVIISDGFEDATPAFCQIGVGSSGLEGVTVEDSQIFVCGMDSHAIFSRLGTTSYHYRNLYYCETVGSFNRHAAPSIIKSPSGVVVEDCILLGANCGVYFDGTGTKLVRNCFISPDGNVANGYAVFTYATKNGTINDNVCLTRNGRGILLNSSESDGGIHVYNNLIHHREKVNAEFGANVHPAGIRCRYAGRGHYVHDNYCFGVGGRVSAEKQYGGVTGLYLTLSVDSGGADGDLSRFDGNRFDCFTTYIKAILPGINTTLAQAHAAPLAPEGCERDGFAWQVDNNEFNSNHRLITLQGYNGYCDVYRAWVGNKFNRLDPTVMYQSFRAAVEAKTATLGFIDNPWVQYAMGLVWYDIEEAIDAIDNPTQYDIRSSDGFNGVNENIVLLDSTFPAGFFDDDVTPGNSQTCVDVAVPSRTGGRNYQFGKSGRYPFDSSDVDTGADTIELVGHSLTTGDNVTLYATTPPGGLANLHSYFVSVSGDLIKFHKRKVDALAVTNVIDITSVGAGSDMEFLYPDFTSNWTDDNAVERSPWDIRRENGTANDPYIVHALP